MALESAQFVRNLQQMTTQTAAAGRAISGALDFAKGAAIGLASAISFDLFRTQVQAAFDYADAIVDLGARTGATTKSIQEFRYAAQLTGSDVASADAALEKFAKNFGSVMNGNDAMARKFADLGVTSRDFDTAIRQTIEGISHLPTIAQRNAAALEIFGKAAGTLTALMGQGAAGFDQLSAAAQQLGIVIEDDVLQNAGSFNDTMDKMSMVLTAQLANVIVQNADSIAQLGNSFITATAAAVNFFNTLKVESLMARRNGNFWTPAIDRLTGTDSQAEAARQLKGTTAGRSAIYADNNRRYRQGLREGRSPNEAYMQALKGENQQVLQAELAARRAARASRTPRPITPGVLPTPKAKPEHKPKPPKGRSAEEIARDFDRESGRINSEILRARQNLAVEATDYWQFEREMISADMQARIEQIEANKDYTRAQKDALKQQLIGDRKSLGPDADIIVGGTDLYSRQLAATGRAENEKLAREQADILRAQVTNDRDLLSGQQSLATTAKQRRDFGLRMVAYQYQQERIELELVRDSATSSKAQKDIAIARLAILGQLQSGDETAVRENTKGPLEDYLSRIPATAAEANEALEAIQVGGLESLEEGLMGVLEGTKSVSAAFGDMANYIIKSLVRIALQQAIIKPLAGALFGGGEGGGKGILGSILGAVVTGITGKRANGGLTRPGDYLMGERGPEIVRVGNSATVIPTHKLGFSGGSRAVNITFGSIVSNDPDAIRRAAGEAVAQALPAILPAATSHSRSQFSRPRM